MSEDEEDDAVDEIWMQKTMRREEALAAALAALTGAKASATADFISVAEYGTSAAAERLLQYMAGQGAAGINIYSMH